MTIQLNISDVILQPELNAAQITITPIFSSVIPDVNKQYVDDGLALKVNKVDDHSLVPDAEIYKLSEYPEFEDLEFSHEKLTDKNSEAAFQHVDTTTVKPTLDAADMVAIKDSVTGKMVLTPKTQFVMTQQEAWITPTLLNGWVNMTGLPFVQYRRNNFGELQIRGYMKRDSGTGAAFVLPTGYRPIADTYLPIISSDAARVLKIDIYGNVTPQASTGWSYLNNTLIIV